MEPDDNENPDDPIHIPPCDSSTTSPAADRRTRDSCAPAPPPARSDCRQRPRATTSVRTRLRCSPRVTNQRELAIRFHGSRWGPRRPVNEPNEGWAAVIVVAVILLRPATPPSAATAVFPRKIAGAPHWGRQDTYDAHDQRLHGSQSLEPVVPVIHWRESKLAHPMPSASAPRGNDEWRSNAKRKLSEST